jgi:DNA-binding transcriptional LysR family regulator
MKVFAAVSDEGSFIGAARTLGLSKPAVSRHVAELEGRLGVRLLHRTTRRLSLTPEGEAFHARCKALLADLEAAEAEVTHRADRAIGVLKVNVPVSYGLLRLARLWGRFMAQHPQVELDVTLSDRFVDLVEEGFDLAVRIGRLGDSSLVSRRLGSTRLVACASPQYLREHGVPPHPWDLAYHQTIGYSLLADGDLWRFEPLDVPDAPCAPNTALAGHTHAAAAAVAAEAAVTVRVKPRLWSNSGDTCCAVARSGAGIVLKPQFLVADDLVRGTLVELLPGWRAPELGIHAVYPSRRHLAPKVRLLVDFLVEALAEPALGEPAPSRA